MLFFLSKNGKIMKMAEKCQNLIVNTYKNWGETPLSSRIRA